MNIIFMGTPDFAAPCLARLLADGHTVSGVFSQPDRPKGRGYTLAPTPVKALALAHGLNVYQPATLRSGEAAEIFRELRPDAAVVVAYGKILPGELLQIPRLGCINVHASLLPRLRGAAPIQWSVINGDTETGVTTMYMAEGMDTGDIIRQRATHTGETETAGDLFGRLSQMGAELLSETLRLLESGEAERKPQNEALATYAPIITKQMAEIDFTATAKQVCNFVRGMNPAPCAYTKIDGKRLKVHEAATVEGYRGAPGEILDKKRLIIGCGDGAAELVRVQPEGKAVMGGSAFICGRKVGKDEINI